MGQVNTADIVLHQAAQLLEHTQSINALTDANQQLSASNKALAEQYRALQTKAGIEPTDPLYINFDAAAQQPAPASVPGVQAAVKAVVDSRAMRRAKK